MSPPTPRLSVDEALDRILALARPVGLETVALTGAAGRVLRRDLVAARTQPPFDASAMDGYAVRRTEATVGARLRVVAEIPAGVEPPRALAPGEAMRIFTGAPTPEGADAIALQEDVDAVEEAGARWAVVRAPLGDESYIRPAGGDFRAGAPLLAAPRPLSPEDVALAAAAGRPWLDVARRPTVALLAIGDELALPGEPLGPSAIAASNGFGVAALSEALGAAPELHPVVRDDRGALDAALDAVGGADVIVTLGGASEGDHDLSKAAFEAAGAEIGFHKIAMRPGKPLMAGRLGRAVALGLPGNPVSAMVCARLFLGPTIEALLGLAPRRPARRRVILGADLAANGPREHYERARLVDAPDGPRAVAADSQDSSLLSVLAAADLLLVRPPHDPPRDAGASLDAILLRPDAARRLDETVDTKLEQQ